MTAPGARQLLRGGVLLTAGALVQAVVGLGAQLVLMRLLMPEAFGEFATVLAVCGLVQMLLSFRVNVLIIRVSEADLAARRALYGAALVWETAAAAAVTVAWVSASGLMSPAAATVILSLTVGHWTNQAVAFFERGMPYSRIVAVETGSQVAAHLVAVALVTAGTGPAALYARELVATLARLAAFAAIGALPAPVWRRPCRADLSALAREARGLWADGVLEGGFSRLVVLAAAGLGGAHGAGVFAQSQRLATIPHQFLAPSAIRLGANLFSRTADDRRRRALLLGMLSGMVGLLAVAAAVMVGIADPVVPLLLGEHWRPAVEVLAAMAGVVVFFSGFELLRTYCLARHRAGLVVVARLVQYVAFLIAAVLAAGAVEPVRVLAAGLSAAYVAGFVAVAVGLAATRPKESVPCAG